MTILLLLLACQVAPKGDADTDLPSDASDPPDDATDLPPDSDLPATDTPADSAPSPSGPPRCVYPGPFPPGHAFAFTDDHPVRRIEMNLQYRYDYTLARKAIGEAIDMDGRGPPEVSVLYETSDLQRVRRLTWLHPPRIGVATEDDTRVAALESSDGHGAGGVESIGDIDGDGQDDVALVVEEVPMFTVTVYSRAWRPFRGTKTFESADWIFAHPVWDSEDSLLANIWIADFTGDGAADVFTSGRSRGRGYDLEYDSLLHAGPHPAGIVDISSNPVFTVTWPERPAYPMQGHQPTCDLNGDGYPDLVTQVWNDGQGQISIFFSPIRGPIDPELPDASIALSIPPDHVGPFEISNYVGCAGDVDGDGSQDLLAATELTPDLQPGAGTVYLFTGPLQQGERLDERDAYAWFTWPHTWAYPNLVRSAGDLDGDGRDDFYIGMWGTRTELEPPEHRMPVVGAPVDTAIDTDVQPAGPYPFGIAEGAVIAFGNPHPGQLQVEDALFILKGAFPGALATRNGMSPIGDQDGDGFPDLAWSTNADNGLHINITHPCADFGTIVR
ncbi:MAG TPA: VCBS repeat-containing protein [Myxococcota bacterium]|nr:VCBS repeat-containing protein [Myxococcota bacterium]